MRMIRQMRTALKRFAFGSWNLPQFCNVGLADPQSEVNVWLHGIGARRNVTDNNVAVAARPFTIGIVLDGEWDAAQVARSHLSLKFHERGGENRLLGEIGLRPLEAIPVGGERLHLFEAENSKNYCLPRAVLWRRYFHYSYDRWRSGRRSNASDIRMVARDVHSLFVFYICPRPVFLISVMDGDRGNIFPMDLTGPIGAQYFSLSLHSTCPATLMERSRRIAVSSIPVEQTSLAFELGKNHKKPFVDWDQIPFATTSSATFGLPVPKFALRVREMRIEAVRTMGSHTMFLAKTIGDQRWADGLQMFQMHGFYQAWKQQGQPSYPPTSNC
jgi:flavin reductase (DIM6/NTAB) family NADH-FMN oxidoreductase RutF